MRITYRQTGGFAGISRGCDLDTGDMGPAERKMIENAAEEAIAQGATTTRAKQARDAIVHDIHVEVDGKSTQLSFDDVTVPAHIQQLIDLLQTRALVNTRR